MLIFLNGVKKKIYEHAKSEYPKECCGVLAGKRGEDERTVCKVIPTKNAADAERRNTYFSINPLELMRIEQEIEQEELQIVGFYHSHPDCDAIASKEDAAHMIEGYSYPIVEIRNGDCLIINSYTIIVKNKVLIHKEKIIEECEG